MLHPTPKLGDVVRYKPAGRAETDAKVIKVFDAETLGVEYSGKTRDRQKTDAKGNPVDVDATLVAQPVRMGDGDGRWHWPTSADKAPISRPSK